MKSPKKKLKEKQIIKSRIYLGFNIIFLGGSFSIIFVLNYDLNESFVITLLALPFLLFLPGYLLIYVLFPKKGDLGGIERALLSFGLSLIFTPIIGLLLNYTPFGISLIYMHLVLSIFTALMCIFAFSRVWGVVKEDRYIFSFRS